MFNKTKGLDLGRDGRVGFHSSNLGREVSSMRDRHPVQDCFVQLSYSERSRNSCQLPLTSLGIGDETYHPCSDEVRESWELETQAGSG